MSKCSKKHGSAKKRTYGGKRKDIFCDKCDRDITPVEACKKRARQESKEEIVKALVELQASFLKSKITGPVEAWFPETGWILFKR